jgi:hypothetical protein
MKGNSFIVGAFILSSLIYQEQQLMMPQNVRLSEFAQRWHGWDLIKIRYLGVNLAVENGVLRTSQY